MYFEFGTYGRTIETRGFRTEKARKEAIKEWLAKDPGNWVIPARWTLRQPSMITDRSRINQETDD